MRALRFLLAGLGSVAGLLLAVPIAAAAAPFWAVAALARPARHLLEAVRPRAVPWQELMEFDAGLGWRPRAGLDAHAEGDRVFHLRTDADGWRGEGTLEGAGVVVFGDSFAFGHGADEGEFFAQLLDEPRVKSLGANGYSMVQPLMLMERLAQRLEGKLVVWMVYYGNDLYDNLQPYFGRYRTPFVREAETPEGWELVDAHLSPEPWPFPRERRYHEHLAELCSPTRLARRVYAGSEYLIRRGARACARAGARLVVVGIPDISQMDEAGIRKLRRQAPDAAALDPHRPDRELEEICGRLEVPFVALSGRMGRDLYKAADCHWNRKGQRAFAELLRSLHGDGGAPPGSSPRPAPAEEHLQTVGSGRA